MKKFIEELKSGELIDSLFSVKYKRAVSDYANGWRFAFGVSDRTGEVEVSYWGGNDQKRVQDLHDSFKEDDVIRIQGIVGIWKDKKKIDINEGRGAVSRAEAFDPEDFLPKSGKDMNELEAQLLELVDGVGDEGLRALMCALFRDPEFMKGFRRAPAAMYLHHAWLGGLMEHSLSVAQIVREAGKMYSLDMDLLTVGALLHDIGKVREFEVTTNIKIGEEGMLRGHVVIGEEMVREKAKAVGLDAKTLMKLSHIILSHHGELENGAPKKPTFIEAILVHYADQMDAKASQFERIRKETTSEDFHVYDKNLGQVYLK